MCAKAAEGMRATGALDEPAQWRFEWAPPYTRNEWLDGLQTRGGAIPESQLADLVEGVADAIDAVGETAMECGRREAWRRTRLARLPSAAGRIRNTTCAGLSRPARRRRPARRQTQARPLAAPCS